MNIETMEGRTLFSVTVSEVAPGYYQFDGDSAADEINVSLDMENATLSFNDTQYSDVAYIIVNGGGGNDTINVIATAPADIGATINGDDGGDLIICNFDAIISAGGGRDEIHLGDAYDGQVYGDAGADTIYISGNCAGAVVDGGAGGDLIDATGNLYGATLYGGAGDDQIYGSEYGDTIYAGSGADIIVAFGGNDLIYSATDGAIDWIDAGDGYDTLYGDTVEIEIQNVETFN
jgi:Ca2+-binding RTX toxin-like protein